jgi:hypothetical protein
MKMFSYFYLKGKPVTDKIKFGFCKFHPLELYMYSIISFVSVTFAILIYFNFKKFKSHLFQIISKIPEFHKIILMKLSTNVILAIKRSTVLLKFLVQNSLKIEEFL